MNRRRFHSGFTLVELAVACAAGAILIGAVLIVLTTILRDRQRLATLQSSGATDQTQIITLLRRDLAAATDIESTSNNKLVLRTCDSLHANDFQPSDRLCTVTYRVLSNSSLHWLVREQQYIDEPVTSRPTRNLVCYQIKCIRVERLNPPVAAVSDAVSPTPTVAAKPQTLAWNRAHVTLDFDDSTASIDFVAYVP